MLSSSLSTNNKDESISLGIKKIDYTSKLDINEPSLNQPVPVFRILNSSGEIVNNCNSIVVSTYFAKQKKHSSQCNYRRSCLYNTYLPMYLLIKNRYQKIMNYLKCINRWFYCP